MKKKTGLNETPDTYRLAISRALIQKERANAPVPKESPRRTRKRVEDALRVQREAVAALPDSFDIEGGNVSRNADGEFFLFAEGRNEPVEVCDEDALKMYAGRVE